MGKKILIGTIVVLVIIAIAVGASFLKSNSKESENGEAGKQNNGEVSQNELNKSLDSMAESLKATCADFLKGDLSGDPDIDCPGFDKSINQSLCFYCYAVKDNNASLCGKINNDIALRSICQKVNGIPIDNLENK